MKLLVKAAKILDNESAYNNKVMDLSIEDGLIKKIAPELAASDADKIIRYDNLHISQGWFDSSVIFGEPGYEERETLENGLKTAGRSGFTAIALNPGNQPVTDNKGAVSYLKKQAEGQAVNLYPIGALTKGSQGKEMAELFDMQQAGAVGFGDHKIPVSNPNMLKISLQYTQNFEGLVLSFPQENQIARNGQVHEHHQSTYLGLKGIPSLAEELQIVRDLFILEYTGGKLHIPTISTSGSVALIRQAKEKGLDVSCSVAIHHLLLTDEILKDFNTDAKVLPPLRTKNDQKALITGIKDGTIDMVTSDHTPMDIENKKVEFDNAHYGTLGLESALGALLRIVSPKTAVKLLTSGRSRFNIQESSIEEGSPANLTFFNPDTSYELGLEHLWSSSKNSVFLGHPMKGQVYGIVNGTHILLSGDL